VRYDSKILQDVSHDSDNLKDVLSFIHVVISSDWLIGKCTLTSATEWEGGLVLTIAN